MPSIMQLVQIVLSLGLVLILLIGGLWCVKRFNLGSMKSSDYLKLVTGLSLGSKEKLVLIKVGNEHILLGVTQHAISRLAVIADKEMP